MAGFPREREEMKLLRKLGMDDELDYDKLEMQTLDSRDDGLG